MGRQLSACVRALWSECVRTSAHDRVCVSCWCAHREWHPRHWLLLDPTGSLCLSAPTAVRCTTRPLERAPYPPPACLQTSSCGCGCRRGTPSSVAARCRRRTGSLREPGSVTATSGPALAWPRFFQRLWSVDVVYLFELNVVPSHPLVLVNALRNTNREVERADPSMVSR